VQRLLDFFPFTPTSIQDKAITKLEDFVGLKTQRRLFVLKGYAGTGKTTLISSFINWLPSVGFRAILAAPTGRAAKVLGGYAKQSAFTIHKQIYYQSRVGENIVFSLQKNKNTNTIFIVDEASMISDQGGMGGSFLSKGRTLLDDLIEFVFSGKNCQLIFIGDTAQLPPVGSAESPALSTQYLISRYTLHIDSIELTEVTRQAQDSGILFNATLLRQLLQENEPFKPLFQCSQFNDVVKLNGYDIEEEVSSCYSRDGIENTMIVCRSNKQANHFNRYIKYNILFQEDELNAGDLVMVVRNNYFWLKEEVDIDFIANGDMAEIMRVIDFEEKFGFRFANVSLRLLDYKKAIEFEVKIMLDTLMIESPSLGREDGQRLYHEIWNSYSEIRDRKKRQKAVKDDPYFNALQVKFGYAITCHKSQGGQWKNVFVDQGFLKEESINREYMRSLYTGITRAKEKLFLTNFHDRFFND